MLIGTQLSRLPQSDGAMYLPLLTMVLLFPCLFSFAEANSHLPRMILSEKDIAMKRKDLPGDHAHLQVLLVGEPDTLTAVGRNHLTSFDFKNPQQTPLQRKVLWKACTDYASDTDCNFNISVVHKEEKANKVFMCGTNSGGTLCCDVNLTESSPACIASEKTVSINTSIRKFIIKEGEASVLVESNKQSDLYMTYSGSQENVGIHKFGPNRVGPANHNREQHYVGLLISRQRDNSVQDRVFAFYKDKNRDTSLDSQMWIPFVTQVCMSDNGGPKKHMQFSWTSQMNAKLFCGNPDSKQYFSELVHVAAVQADHWEDTRVYALFRNEWGMSAVCVYTIKDIHKVFMNSPFKGGSTVSPANRYRECVPDSTKINLDVLKMIEENSEMEDWVRPANNSGPILFNRHRYTHIYVDSSLNRNTDHHPVLFLPLHNGAIHKVMQNLSQTSVIAEYRPFNHSTHIVNVIPDPASRKLYANSRGELVQVDMSNCTQYGDSYEDCILASDPYCSCKTPHCNPEYLRTQQKVAEGNRAIRSKVHCPGQGESGAVKGDNIIRLASKSSHFLRCPVSSLHAEYTWIHPDGRTPCSLSDQQCLFLIDRMGPEKVGTYKCESVEKWNRKVVAQYELKNRAASLSSVHLWVCLVTVLLALNKQLDIIP
ncbi:semaphorin-7A [Notolabrus celidotus]|uniref:semaphorin-7A n=1 Tax=Notolabrus celidotus TaxID=1203425 RepID=UPI0014901A12|nr:semaphorin-7A [Notolabrus celidotus]